jgi:uncharacterized membrane protein YphA (DoxX/SURF4 family)
MAQQGHADGHGAGVIRVSNPNGLIRRLDATGVPLLAARLFVGGMFAYLAVMKLRDPMNFLKQIHLYGILPTEPALYLNLTATILPWLELLCAAALLLGVFVRGAALTINGMLLFFTPMLFLRAWGIYQGGAAGPFCAIKFDCGCGTGEVFICSKLAENILLQIGALVALFSRSRRLCLSALCTRRACTLPGGRPLREKAHA